MSAQYDKSQETYLSELRRGVEDVVHKVAAVGSRTVAKAKEFIATVAGGDETIKAYGSYAEVYADNVQKSCISFSS